jgi:O-antigen ligase
MDRQAFAQALAASALIMVALYVIDQYGYTDLKALLLLAALAVVATLVSTPSVAGAGLVTLVLYVLIMRDTGDRLVAAAAVGLVALVAALVMERQRLLRL